MSSTFRERFGNRIAKTTSNGTFTRLDGSTLQRNPKLRSASASVPTVRTNESVSVQNLRQTYQGGVKDEELQHQGGGGFEGQEGVRQGRPRRSVLSAHPSSTPSKGGGYASQHQQHQQHSYTENQRREPIRQLHNQQQQQQQQQQQRDQYHSKSREPTHNQQQQQYAVIHPEPMSPGQTSLTSPTFCIETRVINFSSKGVQQPEQVQQHNPQQQHMGFNQYTQHLPAKTDDSPTYAQPHMASPEHSFYRPLPQSHPHAASQPTNISFQPASYSNDFQQPPQQHQPLVQHQNQPHQQQQQQRQIHQQVPQQYRHVQQQDNKVAMGTNPYMQPSAAASRPGVADLMRMLEHDQTQDETGMRETTLSDTAERSIGYEHEQSSSQHTNYESKGRQQYEQSQQSIQNTSNSRSKGSTLNQRSTFLSRRGEAALRTGDSNKKDQRTGDVHNSHISHRGASASKKSNQASRNKTNGSHGGTFTDAQQQPSGPTSSPNRRRRRRRNDNEKTSQHGTRNRASAKPHRQQHRRELRFEPDKQVNELPSPLRVNESLVQTTEDQLYFSRKPRHVEGFQPKSTAEYLEQKPTEYYTLGKLQSDLFTDELVEKRNNKQKVKEYSERRRKENASSNARVNEIQKPHQTRAARSTQAPSARQRALEFARSVPPPRQVLPGKHQNVIVGANESEGGLRNRKVSECEKKIEPSLKEMERKHDRARQEIAQIRMELGMPD